MEHEWRAREVRSSDEREIVIVCESCGEDIEVVADPQFDTCDASFSRWLHEQAFSDSLTNSMRSRFQALYFAVLGHGVPWEPETVCLTKTQAALLGCLIRLIYREEHTKPIDNQRRHLDACLLLSAVHGAGLGRTDNDD